MKKRKAFLAVFISVSTIIGSNHYIQANENKQENIVESTNDSDIKNSMQNNDAKSTIKDQRSYQNEMLMFLIYPKIDLGDFKLNEQGNIEEAQITTHPELEYSLTGRLGEGRSDVELDRFITASRIAEREIKVPVSNIGSDDYLSKEFNYLPILKLSLVTPLPKHYINGTLNTASTISISGTGGDIPTIMVETPRTVMDFRNIPALAPIKLTQSLEPINGVVNPTDYKEIVKEIITDNDLYNVSGDLIAKAGERVFTIQFNEDGTPTTEIQLPIGEYTIRDVQVPENYKLDTTGTKFTMTPSDTWPIKDLGNFEAKVFQKSIKINEYSNKDSSTLESGNYKLYRNDQLLDVQPKIEDQSIIFNNLYTGDYKLVKSYSQEGFATIENIIEFTISNSNVNSPIDINKKTTEHTDDEFGGQVINIFNDPTVNKFVFIDRDTGEEVNVSEGTIYDYWSNEKIAEISGNLEISNLDVGRDYVFSPRRIPKGYYPFKDYEFKVKDTGEVQVHTLKLEKAPIPNVSFPVREYLVNTFINENNTKDKKDVRIGSDDYLLSQDNLTWVATSESKLLELDKVGLIDSNYGFYGYRVSYTDGTSEFRNEQTINYNELANHANNLGKEIQEVYVSYGPKSTIDVNYFLTKKDGSQTLLDKYVETGYYADKLDGYFDVKASSLTQIPLMEKYIQDPNNPTGPIQFTQENQVIQINLREPVINIHFKDTLGKNLIDSLSFSSKIGDSFTYLAPSIEGYKIKVNDSINTQYLDQDLDITVTYEKDEPVIETGKVIASYIDTDGKKLVEDKTISGPVGSTYEFTSQTVDGYKLKEVKGNQNGIFKKEDTTLAFVYEKDAVAVNHGSVVIRYVDMDNKELYESKTLSGEVGSTFSTKAIDIQGYTLDHVSGIESGVFGSTTYEITYTYRKDTIVNPEDDTTGTQPTDSIEITNKNKEVVANDSKDVKPNTGVQDNIAIAALGLIVSSGLIIILATRKKKLKDHN